jgi:glucose/arabinose dehydrogenase
MRSPALSPLAARAVVFAAVAVAALVLQPPHARGASGMPSVPAGFAIERIATVPQARELAVTPNGDLIVGSEGKTVFVVPDAQGAAGAPRAFATFDDPPDAGVFLAGDTLYVGGQLGVYRLPYHDGDRTARAKPEKIATVRPDGPGGHSTTSVAFTKGVLYASVGSSCNACTEHDPTRATIQQMTPDGKEMHAKATGIRNAIALAVAPNGDLWAGVAGRDDLAHGHPYEIFDDVTAHPGTVNYGWPGCYEDRKAVDGTNCSATAVEKVVFPAYDTPIGAVFYPNDPKGPYAFPASYRGGAFVALHGSWHVPPVPPRVAFVPFHGEDPAKPVDWANPDTQWTEFLSGCQSGGSRICRPTGIAVGTDGSLFVAEDDDGAIYRIRPIRR